MSYLEQLRAFALAFDGAYEDFPWEHETPVFKTPAGKIFAMSGVTEDGGLQVTVKLSPEEGVEALALPFVRVASYVGRYGWVTATVTNDAEWDVTQSWVRRSHELVSPKGRRKGKPAASK